MIIAFKPELALSFTLLVRCCIIFNIHNAAASFIIVVGSVSMVSVLSFEAFIIRLEVFNKYYLCFQFGVRLHEAPHEASAFNAPGRLYFNLTFLNEVT